MLLLIEQNPWRSVELNNMDANLTTMEGAYS